MFIVPRQLNPVFSAGSQPVAHLLEDDVNNSARRIPTVITSARLVALAPGRIWDVPLDTPALRQLRAVEALAPSHSSRPHPR